MKIPSNCDIIYSKSIDKNKLVVVLKSACRHYSSITLELENNLGDSVLYVTEVNNRCGIKKAMSKIF